jgi:hypothetical protein
VLWKWTGATQGDAAHGIKSSNTMKEALVRVTDTLIEPAHATYIYTISHNLRLGRAIQPNENLLFYFIDSENSPLWSLIIIRGFYY